MNRVLWFIAGSAAGVVATTKARRAAYRLSVPGLVDQASALGVGVRAFSAEMRTGMAAKESTLRHQALDAPAGTTAHRELTDSPLPIEKDPT